MADDWLSTREAGALLGLKVIDVYRLIDQNRLPGYKIGRVIRLRRDEVEKYRDEPPPPEPPPDERPPDDA